MMDETQFSGQHTCGVCVECSTSNKKEHRTSLSEQTNNKQQTSNNMHHRHIKRNSKGSSNIRRHPFVVFIITFSLLGSLRLRPRKATPLTMTSTTFPNTITRNDNNINIAMEYVMIEEVIGDIDGGSTSTTSSTSSNHRHNVKNIRSYRKYVAIITHQENPMMMNEYTIPTTVTRLNDATTRYVTVSQWVQTIIDTVHNNNNNNNVTRTSHQDNSHGIIMAIDMLHQIIATSPYEAVFWETPAIASYQQYQTQRFEFVLVHAPELHEMTRNQKHHHDIHAFEKPLSLLEQNHSPYAASFPNLGGDAMLIVPKYIPNEGGNKNHSLVVDSIHTATSNSGGSGRVVPYTARYAHLANFVRYHHSLLSSSSDERQMVYAVWQLVAQTYQEQIRSKFASEKKDESSLLSLDQRRVRSSTTHSQHQQQGLWLSTSGLGVLYLHFRIDTVPKYYSHVPYTKIYR